MHQTHSYAASFKSSAVLHSLASDWQLYGWSSVPKGAAFPLALLMHQRQTWFDACSFTTLQRAGSATQGSQGKSAKKD